MTDMPSDKIKPEDNPWYLLATLHGEARTINNEVHARNRTTWNRFMASELTEDQRAFLIQEGRCSAEELVPFTAEELADINRLFAERQRQASGRTKNNNKNMNLPDLKKDGIEFSDVAFDRDVLVGGFLFIQSANFSGAIFSGLAGFEKATFHDHADFQGATFSNWAYFLGTTFCKGPDFRRVTFCLWANFVGATLSRWADFDGATFSSGADFSLTTFSGSAAFSGAIFSNLADFQRASFHDHAGFSGATFSDQAIFSGAIFSKEANFQRARFHNHATFSGATFTGRADFSRVRFSGRASFSGAAFSKDTLFVNAEMENPTWFEDAKFSSEPPQFFGAKLHEGTVWRGVTWPPPPKDQKVAGRFVDAYERLKLEMDRLKKHEDELHFFALELLSRRVLDGDREDQVSELKVFGFPVFLVPPLKIIFQKIKTLRHQKLFGRLFSSAPFTKQTRTIRLPRSLHGLAIALYGWLSDYGRSYVRPLTGLLITVLVGIPFFWWHLAGFWQAVGHSLANTFGVLGFRRELIGADVLTALPGLLKLFAGAQTVAGIVLLFLLGLAIRNRFRMK
jgi:uncharacterized protein YjbI with pentapeptide repeats